MSSTDRVSVVVPVLNGARTIGDMLHALTRQSRQPKSVEIIVVDNGSSDATCDIVRGFDVRLCRATTRGPAAARNEGLNAATGEIVVHLDADTVPNRRWLRAIVAPFADPDVSLVAGTTLSFPPTTGPERYLAQSELYTARTTCQRPVLPFAPSLNMAVRRRAALAVDGWSEDMLTGEDVDFSTRVLSRVGGEIVVAENAVLLHRHRQTDRGLRRQAWTYGEGLAQLYVRFPEAVHWGLRQRLEVARTLTRRSVEPLVQRVAGVVGRGDHGRLEFVRYHRMWAWAYWRGFASFRRTGVYRSP